MIIINSLSGFRKNMDSDFRWAVILVRVSIYITAFFFLVFLAEAIYLFAGGAPLRLAYPISETIGRYYVLAIAMIEFLWFWLAYLTVYSNLRNGSTEKAEMPSLLLGILQLLFGGILSGILLLISWVKIKDYLRDQQILNA